MAKLDIKSAYRLILVHPCDQHLLGIEWKGTQYVDGSLPFGLCSAPKVFTVVADMLHWAIVHEGVAIVDHYFNDFMMLGPPDSMECQQNLDRILSVCTDLGVPLALEKLKSPLHHLTFLGIELDMMEGVLCLPQDKLFLRCTKTDQLMRGTEVYVGTTADNLCLVMAIWDYVACRGVSPGAFFHLTDRTPPTKPRFVELVQQALSWAGISSSGYSGHSFRIEAATAASQTGVPDSVVQALGC